MPKIGLALYIMIKKRVLELILTTCLFITNIVTPVVFAEENSDLNSEIETVQSSVEDSPVEKPILVSVADNSEEMQAFNNSVSLGAYVAIDGKTGEVIMGKNENKMMYPASLTKVLTSLLLIENKSMDDILTVSKAASEVGEASIYVREGENFTAKDLLYAMMLKSANDACHVVAEGVSGTTENFFKLMNTRAKQAGAYNSNFASPHGLHQDDHYTTAYDLAMITKEAIKYPEFREAMGTQSYILTREGDDVLKTIYHTNKMIFPGNKEYNELSLGGKTGFTYEAQNCLIEVAKKDDMEIIVVSLKAAPGQVYPDTNKIINYVLDNYISTSLLTTDELVEDIKGEYLTYAPVESVGYVTKKENSQAISSRVDIELDKDLEGLITKDSVIGTAKVYVNDGLYKSVDLVALNDVEIVVATQFTLLKNLILIVLLIIVIKSIQVFIRYRKRKTQNYMKKSNLY